MASHCERPGCSADAVVSWGFDPRRLLVWLDHLDPDGTTDHGLCGLHATRLRPPRDWWLDDRRLPTPELFAGPVAAVPAEVSGTPPPEPPAPARRRRARRAAPPPEPVPVADDPPLPFPVEP